MVNKFIKSRDGSLFGAEIEIEDDGSLAILTNDGKGYRSAHRDFAQRHFSGRLWCMNRLTWINASGARVVLTRWNTQDFRKGE